MCGRYTLTTPEPVLVERFGARPERPIEPRYNAAPGQALPVIRDVAPDEIALWRWGLVPPRIGDPSDADRPINARAETVGEQPAFREAFAGGRADAAGRDAGCDPAAGRCLVLADGFYVWDDRDGERRPYRVTLDDERPFAMAGLWARWEGVREQVSLDAFADDGSRDPEPERRRTFAVVTTEPNDRVADFHHRMDVILDPGDERRWLRGDPADCEALLAPYPADEMSVVPVSTAVNDPENDRPELIEPVPE